MTLHAIVMAAGHGTRMKSRLPKVLHPICGRPLLYFPVRAALEAGAEQVVVVVNPDTCEPVRQSIDRHLSLERLLFAVQDVPRGTGDAVRAGAVELRGQDDDRVVILSGDTPLLTGEDLVPLCSAENFDDVLTFTTFNLADPTGYGRILRDAQGEVREIREHRDLRTDEEKATAEVNAGLYAARLGPLGSALERLVPNNAQGEYYLTDVVPLLCREGAVRTVSADPQSLLGVNDRAQLQEVEAILFDRIRRRHARAGVSLVGDPLIDDTVELGTDVRIEAGVRLRGATRIGRETSVDVGTVIEDSTIGEATTIKPYCVLSRSEVGSGVQLGPFAHLRPDSVVEDEAHLGNFVETKKTVVRRGAKANHLAYLGDADVGEHSNLGAGTIICNYDGFRKRRTVIGKGVFVGSDSQLVAPVEIGDGAYVATATTVTRNVPADALAIGRVRQENKEGYASQLRTRLKASAERDREG